MLNQPQQLANAIAAMAKNTMSGMLAAGAPASPRPRSISEILDIDRSFVSGYPTPRQKPNGAETD